MNIETVKQEYMTMYDSLKRKIEDELKKFTYSTFFVDSQYCHHDNISQQI